MKFSKIFKKIDKQLERSSWIVAIIPLISVIGIYVTNIIYQVKLNNSVYNIIFWIILILTLVILFYFGFLKESEQNKKSMETKIIIITRKKYKKNKLKIHSRLTLIAIIVILLITSDTLLPSMPTEKKVIVLLAQLENRSTGKDDQAMTDILEHKLMDLDERYRIKVIKRNIIGIDKNIARSEGEKAGASIIIWGWYTKRMNDYPMAINYELIGLPNITSLYKNNINSLRFYSINEFQSSEIKYILPSQVNDLTLITVSLADILDKEYRQASKTISERIEKLNLSESKKFLLNYLGYLQLFNGKYDDALNVFDKVLEMDKHDIDTGIQIGIIQAEKGMYDNSVKYFNKLISWLKENPKFITSEECLCSVYTARGYVYYLMSKYNLAINDFETSLKINESPYTLYLKSLAEFELGNFNTYISNIRKSKELGLKEDIFYLRISGNKFLTHYIKARELLLLNEVEKSISELNKSIEYNSNFSRTYFYRGMINLYIKMDINQAHKDFLDAIRIDPKYAEAYAIIGNVLNIRGLYNKALEKLNYSIRLNPDNYESYRARSFTNIMLDRYELSIGDINKALSLSPNNLDALNTLGIIYSLNGSNKLAIDTFSKALLTDKDYFFTYLNLGNYYLDRNEYSQSYDKLTKAISIFPQSSLTSNSFGFLYFKKGDYLEAEKHFIKAALLSPGFAKFHSDLGDLYEHMSKYEKALNEFDSAIKLEPNNLTYLLKRAYNLRYHARNIDGINDSTTAIRINPKLAEAYRIRAILRSDMVRSNDKKTHQLILNDWMYVKKLTANSKKIKDKILYAEAANMLD
jgi:tetratricopeptide (TPR) repeat protein